MYFNVADLSTMAGSSSAGGQEMLTRSESSWFRVIVQE